MKKNIQIVIIVVIFSFFNYNCKEEEQLTMDISGVVYSISENENFEDQNLATDVRVLREDTGERTYTDSSGRYYFTDIPIIEEIEFTLEFSKDGYSETKRQVYLSPDGGQHFQTAFLYENSSTELSSDLKYDFLNYDINFATTILQNASEDFNRGIVILIDSTENVSLKNHFFSKPLIIESGNEISTKINVSLFAQTFPDDYTFYAIAYGISENFNPYKSVYEDKDGVNVYMGLNETPSNVVSFTIPSE